MQYSSENHANSRLHYDMVKVVSVLSYFTILGWVLALSLYGNHQSSLARFHLRQSLGLTLAAAILVFIPLIGWALYIVIFFMWLIGVYHALNNERYKLPIVGDFFQTHLDFIK